MAYHCESVLAHLLRGPALWDLPSGYLEIALENEPFTAGNST